MRYAGYKKAIEKIECDYAPNIFTNFKQNLKYIEEESEKPFNWSILYAFNEDRIRVYHTGCNRIPLNAYSIPYEFLFFYEF